MGVVAFLAGRPAARWVVAEHFGRVRDPLDLAVPFSMGVLVCAAATALPLLLARQRLNALERG
jgi:ABC-2 type transport system permease protein